MAQSDRGAGVSIAEDELIVELEDELRRIKGFRTAHMHSEMGQSLVSEKIW